MKKQKSLLNYLTLIKSAQDNRDWSKAKRYGEIALKKLPALSYSPVEEYSLYCRLGYVYLNLAEFSRSLNTFYKADLIASKNHLDPAYNAYVSFGIGKNFGLLRNFNQALTQFQKVEKYCRKNGYDVSPMNKQLYMDTLVAIGFCYLYENKLEEAQKIIEQKLTLYQPIQSGGFFAMNYLHLKGEYLMTIKEYTQSRQSFQACIEISQQLKFLPPTLEAKIHLATIDLLDGQLDMAVQKLESLLKDARQLKLNDYICRIALLLSKCYTLKKMPDKTISIEKLIKPFLNKVDIIWLYEKTREFEQLFHQLQSIYQNNYADTKSLPIVLTHSLNQRYEKLPYNIIGQSFPMQEVYTLIEKGAPTDLPILIQGETGSGKELVARIIHHSSLRKNTPFITQNCASVNESLLESELFGHVKGAFTDAIRDKRGLFELADHGTLFLDEIGEMSLGMQSKLLRAIEQGEIKRVGDEKLIGVDVRIISATNKDIKLLIQQGKFREDLYYRLQGINITLPPLRERKKDIPLLINYFLDSINKRINKKLEFNIEALKLLMDYPWPGNVRELKTEIERAATMAKSKIITPYILSSKVSELTRENNQLDFWERFQGKSLQESMSELERELLLSRLEHTDWNKTMTARLLKIRRSTLYNKIKIYKLKQSNG